jgi:tetratricopeptide (TPR) repeat protein
MVRRRVGGLSCTPRRCRRRSRQERALAITEAALYPDHPDNALRLGNLARTYSALGRHAEALLLEERALAVTEAALGPDHLDAAVCLGNLATTYRAVGRTTDAEALERRAQPDGL